MRAGMDAGGCFPTGRHYPGIAHLIKVVVQGLADGFDGEHAVSDLALVGIDTETTGRDPGVDRIVEVATVVFRGGAVVERKQWLVNPGRPIPDEAKAVHGIGDDDVRDAPPFSSVVPELLEALRGKIPVAYNAEFDRDFLRAELARTGTIEGDLPPAVAQGVEWIDPFVWAGEIQKGEKGLSLVAVCQRLGIEIGRAHRAADDAEAALRVLDVLCRDSRAPRTYAAFVQEQRRLARELAADRAVWRS